MKQNKLSLFLVTLASGFLLCQNAGAYSTWMEECTYQANGRLGDPDTGKGNFWNDPIWCVQVTNTGSLNGLTNGLVQSFGDRICIYPTNASGNNAPYAKWGNIGDYNPGSASYPSAGTNLYFSFLYKFDDSGTPLNSVGQRVVQMEKQNSGLTSSGNISYFHMHCREAGGNINLGVSKYSAGTAPALTNWATTNLHYGQTFFVVCKLAYCGNGHTPFETNAIWINPNTNYFNVSEPPAGASASVADGSDDTGPTGPGRLFIDVSGQSAEMDEIRVGNFWPDVTPQAGQCLVPKFSASPGNLTNGAANVTNIEGEALSFTVKTVATGPTYSWQISKDSGSTWTTLAGEIGNSYATPNLWIGTDQGNKYRAICYSDCNGNYATSAVATVTLKAPVKTPVGLIMYDNFSDKSPANSPVFTNNSLWYTAVAGSMDASDPEANYLQVTPLTTTSTLYMGYFIPELQSGSILGSNTNLPVSLDVTNALVVTFPFHVGTRTQGQHTNNGPLRFGTFDYNDGGILITNDDALVTGGAGKGWGVRGYMADIDFGTNFTANSPLSLLVRDNILDNNLTGTTGGIWRNLGNGPTGGGFTNMTSFKADTDYLLVFQVNRCNTNYCRVTATFTGNGSNWTFTARDTNQAYYRFDSFAMRANTLETSADTFKFPYYEVQVQGILWECEDMHMAQAVRSGNDVNLSWTSHPGTDKASFAYSVQYKTNILDPNWVTLQTNYTHQISSSTTIYTHTNAPNATGFYRIRCP